MYEAFDHKRHSIVVVETLSRVERRVAGALRRELRTLADITHPNLVMLYELLSQADEWFFTMELVGGVHILKYVRGEDPSASAILSLCRMASTRVKPMLRMRRARRRVTACGCP